MNFEPGDMVSWETKETYKHLFGKVTSTESRKGVVVFADSEYFLVAAGSVYYPFPQNVNDLNPHSFHISKTESVKDTLCNMTNAILTQGI